MIWEDEMEWDGRGNFIGFRKFKTVIVKSKMGFTWMREEMEVLGRVE